MVLDFGSLGEFLEFVMLENSLHETCRFQLMHSLFQAIGRSVENADFDSYTLETAASIGINIARPYVSGSSESQFLFSLFLGFLVSVVAMAEILTL